MDIDCLLQNVLISRLHDYQKSAYVCAFFFANIIISLCANIGQLDTHFPIIIQDQSKILKMFEM